MSDYIIKVENLGKKYRIQHQQERQRYVALREVIANGLRGLGSSVLKKSHNLMFRNGRSLAPGSSLKLSKSSLPVPSSQLSAPACLTSDLRSPSCEEFWALKDTSFEVKEGEVVGIIGRNGAGKSTLLKILSRITEPTEGRVRIRGRVASLLEVGTGFHPELTGRENIYVNGAILGMTRKEISAKFDEIVAFAEIEKFLDTPVKRYSSGMYVRLAFAVAAHLQPEILLVDEVLAVGDASFQKKCLGKISEVAHTGRTVLFVSHNLEAVRRLCSRGVLLEQGKLLADGSVGTIISRYIDSGSPWKTAFVIPAARDKDSQAFATEVLVEDLDSTPTNGFAVGQPWQVRVAFTVIRRAEHLIVAIGLVSDRGIPVWTVWSKPCDLEPGAYTAIFRNEQISLCSGSYNIHVGLSIHERPVHYVEDAGVLGVAEVANGADVRNISGGAGFILNPMSHSIAQP